MFILSAWRGSGDSCTQIFLGFCYFDEMDGNEENAEVRYFSNSVPERV
jgi:hypothetical protein